MTVFLVAAQETLPLLAMGGLWPFRVAGFERILILNRPRDKRSRHSAGGAGYLLTPPRHDSFYGSSTDFDYGPVRGRSVGASVGPGKTLLLLLYTVPLDGHFPATGLTRCGRLAGLSSLSEGRSPPPNSAARCDGFVMTRMIGFALSSAGAIIVATLSGCAKNQAAPDSTLLAARAASARMKFTNSTSGLRGD